MDRLPKNHELIIRLTLDWFTLNLAEVWRYRDPLFLFIATSRQNTNRLFFGLCKSGLTSGARPS
jgi:hypothetical protein